MNCSSAGDNINSSVRDYCAFLFENENRVYHYGIDTL